MLVSATTAWAERPDSAADAGYPMALNERPLLLSTDTVELDVSFTSPVAKLTTQEYEVELGLLDLVILDLVARGRVGRVELLAGLGIVGRNASCDCDLGLVSGTAGARVGITENTAVEAIATTWRPRTYELDARALDSRRLTRRITIRNGGGLRLWVMPSDGDEADSRVVSGVLSSLLVLQLSERGAIRAGVELVAPLAHGPGPDEAEWAFVSPELRLNFFAGALYALTRAVDAYARFEVLDSELGHKGFTVGILARTGR